MCSSPLSVTNTDVVDNNMYLRGTSYVVTLYLHVNSCLLQQKTCRNFFSQYLQLSIDSKYWSNAKPLYKMTSRYENHSYSRVVLREMILYEFLEHTMSFQQNHSLPKRTFSIYEFFSQNFFHSCLGTFQKRSSRTSIDVRDE